MITHTKSTFARHGIPNVVVSDNGPCFSSRELRKFAQEFEFCHVTSSPHYAKSNGQAEKGVHILKQLLKKAADSRSDPYLALLRYRASPLQCGLSPAELLMNRKLRTTLPRYSKATTNRKHAKVKYTLSKQKVTQKTFYDLSAKPLSALSNSDPVRNEDADGWNTKGTVLQEVAPRSFTSKTEDGPIRRRNRRSLLKIRQSSIGPNNADSQEPATTLDENCNVNLQTNQI